MAGRPEGRTAQGGHAFMVAGGPTGGPQREEGGNEGPPKGQRAGGNQTEGEGGGGFDRRDGGPPTGRKGGGGRRTPGGEVTPSPGGGPEDDGGEPQLGATGERERRAARTGRGEEPNGEKEGKGIKNFIARGERGRGGRKPALSPINDPGFRIKPNPGGRRKTWKKGIRGKIPHFARGGDRRAEPPRRKRGKRRL